MEDLRKLLKNARNELKQKIQIKGELREELAMEIIEMKELEKKLKKYIKDGEEILKQNFKKN